MKFKRFIKKYIPNILKTIFIHTYVRLLYCFKYKKILARNKKLKDQYKGKRCFIVGNGPSLNQMNLLKLKDDYIFVVNHFYLHKDLKEIKPKFYLCIEPVENLLKIKVNITDFYSQIDKAFRGIDVKMFYRVDSKKYIKKNNLFLDKDVYYLLPDLGILKTLIISDDISKYYSFSDTSIYCAICIAVYMGFSEIYLIGCDYNHILHKDEKHFYRDEEVEVVLGSAKSNLKNASNLVLAENLYIYLKGMEKLKHHFKKYNVKIFNAGMGGMIDTFERVDYDSLFQ